MGGKYDLCACPAEFLQLSYEHIQLHGTLKGYLSQHGKSSGDTAALQYMGHLPGIGIELLLVLGYHLQVNVCQYVIPQLHRVHRGMVACYDTLLFQAFNPG